MGVTIIALFVAGARIPHLLVVVSCVIPVGVSFILFEPYRLARLMNFLNPWMDARGDGYQLIQSLLAL